MAKKGAFERLLGGLIASSRKSSRQETEEPEFRGTGRMAEETAPAVKKEPGLLDPLMAVLSSDEKFLLISSLMDFSGDFLAMMLDLYNFELTKVENAISAFQSTMLNQVRLIRNQIDIARQQGLFKARQPVSAFPLPPGASIAMGPMSTGATEGLEKKRQPTERDIMDIAASIRTLVTRQKLAKGPSEDAAATPATSAPESPAPLPSSTSEEIPGISSLDSKIEQFQKHGDEQKQRIEIMSTASRPVKPAKRQPSTGTKKKQQGGKKSSKKAPQQKPGTKPAAKKAPSKKAPKPAAKEAPAKPAEPAPPMKLDKERDMLPEGFQAELMKNIKGLMKDKEKSTKKT